MRIINLLGLMVTSLALTWATNAAAATLIADGSGNLTGATGVNIDGTLYNVTFQDGTCISVFGGCDSNSDFVIPKAQTFDAAQALLDQVFTGEFDISPSLTVGCSAPEVCFVMIPTHLETSGEFLPGTVFFGEAINYDASTGTDGTASGFIAPSHDTTPLINGEVWAVFSLAAVPEPSSWAMMLLGFAAVGMMMPRKGRALLAA